MSKPHGFSVLCEKVSPSNGYSCVCYKVTDGRTNETIFRTADREYAEGMAEAVNGFESMKANVDVRIRQIERLTESRDRLRKRFHKMVDSLKELAGSCVYSRDCGTCYKAKKCPMREYVAEARAFLNEEKITWHLKTGIYAKK